MTHVTSLTSEFTRVKKWRPCPVCGRPDWCMVSRDEPPSRAICARVEARQRFGDAGWLHRLRQDGRPHGATGARTARITMQSVPDLASLAAGYRRNVPPDRVERFAARLGLGLDSLARLGLGWTGQAWAFPMTGADGRVRGIRLRRPDGTKYAVRGGRDGLFIPADLGDAAPFVVCEGPTDTAAMLDLGFDAAGRPSCAGGTRLLVALVRRRRPRSLVVMADADGAGQRGAAVLANALATYCRDVRLVTPPAKDARAWLNAGASRGAVLDLIQSAEPVRVRTSVRRAGQ